MSTPRSFLASAEAKRRLTREQLHAELSRGASGVGVVLGDPSGGLVDVDLDCAEAVELAPFFLPPTNLLHGRLSRPASHWWYDSPGATTIAFSAPHQGTLVELRATGAQTLVPPSKHPSGETLRWRHQSRPPTVEADALRTAVGRLAAAAYLLARRWPPAEAVALARDPNPRLLERLVREAGAPPLHAWLLLTPPSDIPATPAQPCHAAATATPYTCAILERVDVRGAAALLGIPLSDAAHQPCPFHDDRQPSFQVTGRLWRCHAGCGSGTAIHLAALALDVDYQTARNWLASRLGIDWRDYRS